MSKRSHDKLLFTGADWTFDKVMRVHDAVAEIAHW